MEGSMIDKEIFEIVYLLKFDEVGVIATVKDTYYQELVGTSIQVQVSDLNVDITKKNIENSSGFISLDVGGLAVTNPIKELLLSMGCNEDMFRSMSVNNEPNILWQIIAPGQYELLNESLPRSIDSSVYRGPLDDVMLELGGGAGAKIGCLKGREDYQELFFSKEIFEGLHYKFNIKEFFIGLPVYGGDFKNIVAGKYASISSKIFKDFNVDQLDYLRGKELMALLKFASEKSMSNLGDEVYQRLKAIKLPLEEKKKAMKLHKIIRK